MSDTTPRIPWRTLLWMFVIVPAAFFMLLWLALYLDDGTYKSPDWGGHYKGKPSAAWRNK